MVVKGDGLRKQGGVGYLFGLFSGYSEPSRSNPRAYTCNSKMKRPPFS